MPSSHTPVSEHLTSWIVPISSVVIGAAYLLIGLGNDDVAGGVIGLLIMLAYGGGLVLFRRRSEAMALLSADVTDERQSKIMIGSLAAAGVVMVLVVLGGMTWSMIAENQYVGVFTGLSAVGGATFIAATVWQSRHG